MKRIENSLTKHHGFVKTRLEQYQNGHNLSFTISENKIYYKHQTDGGSMQVGNLVRHEGLCEDVGIIVFFRDFEFKGCCSVYFPRLDKAMTVFMDDLELIC